MLFVLVAFAVGGVLPVVRPGSVSEEENLPSYAGLSAEEWFNGGGATLGISDSKAFSMMGTNAVPFLLRKAGAGETLRGRLYAWVYAKIPPSVRKRLPVPQRMSPIDQRRATQYLGWMEVRGNRLSNWDDDLVRLSHELENRLAGKSATRLAGRVLARSEDVELAKAFHLALFKPRDFDIRLMAAIQLARVDPSLTNGIPILANAVTNTALLGVPAGFASNRQYVEHLRATDPDRMMIPNMPGSRISPIQWQSSFDALKRVAPVLADRLCPNEGLDAPTSGRFASPAEEANLQ